MRDMSTSSTHATMLDTSTPALKHRQSWSKLSRLEPLANDAETTVQRNHHPTVQKRFYTFSPNNTSINFPWPQELTGLERIACSAKGDLQRVLSAFFARPISIALVYANTYHQTSPNQRAVPLALPNPSVIASASHITPIIQTRQVHLQCSGKVVCTATSTVRMTSHESAHLFLEEKYAIGQMFAHLEKAPDFDLLSVGFGPVPDDTTTAPSDKTQLLSFGTRHEQQQQLWRKYRLSIAGFECEILEVFPSREMFTAGTQWLDADTAAPQEWGLKSEDFVTSTKEMSLSGFLRPQTAAMLLGVGFLLMLAFKLSMFFTERSLFGYL